MKFNYKFLVILSLLLCISTIAAGKKDYEKIEKKQNEANKKNRKEWKAKLDPDFNYDDDDFIKNLLGTKIESDDVLKVRIPKVEEENKKLDSKRVLQAAASLDLRTKYPNCASIPLIRNQSQCGSCWAFSTTNSASDRFCIKYNTAWQFSQKALGTCCKNCSDKGVACNGGWPNKAFDYMLSTGLVSGEAHGDLNYCQPYWVSPTQASTPKQPACTATCDKNAKTTNLKKKINAYTSFFGQQKMINELNTKGSISCALDIYQDFMTYSSGVYVRKSTRNLGGHAVRVIGYGKSSTGVNFWLVANTWGKNWGEAGFFRIRRGTNECRIETYSCYGATFN